MKTLIFTCFTMLISSVIFQQEPVGKWSGTLDVQGTTLNLILHITKTANHYKATLDSPDQNAYDIPVTSVTFHDPDLTLEISNLGVLYVGTLRGNLLDGKWMQSGRSFSLLLSK